MFTNQYVEKVFNKFEKDCVDETDKTETLVKQIKDIDRKLIVTTIQKMANAIKNPRYSKILDIISASSESSTPCS